MSTTCADALAELSAANATIADLVVQLSALTVAEEPVEDPCALAADAATYDRAFHIGAAFIVLAASGLGVVSTLVAKRFPALRLSDNTIVLGKTFGTGIVLATALVLMLQPGTNSLASECIAGIMGEDYPAYSFLFALLAAMLMQGIEYAAGRAFAARKAASIVSAECPVIDCLREVITADSSTDAAIAVSVPRHSHSIGGHSVLIGLLMAEFSFTLHSIFIGLAVGLSGGDGLNALLTALVFHQFFDGMSLGARLHESIFSSLLDMVFAAVFSVSAPIGIGIAVEIMGSAVPVQGATFIVAQGVFDSICGGILLYIGFTLLLLDFPADMAKMCSGSKAAGGKLTGPQAEGWRVIQFATLWAGAGLMAFLGRWV